MTSNARAAYTSKINGLLVPGTNYAHNLGILSGTGTLRTATNTFPAWTDPKIDPTAIVQINLTAFDGRTVLRGLRNLIRERLEREFVNLSSGVYLLQMMDGQARENYRIIRY